MAGISKSGPQYKDKILPADDNFLKIVTVRGGYLEEVRVLCVAEKEAAHMNDYMKALHQRFCQEPEGTEEEREMD